MSNLYEIIAKGGPTMVPMVGLSVLTFSCAMERFLFWTKVMLSERKIVPAVLSSAQYSLLEARDIAEQASDTPMGRFLLAPLRLNNPTPETFRLAMESAGDQEFVEMRKGDKILESSIGIAPLLGLLGTVTGLIATFNNLNIGGGSGGAGSAADLSKAAAGIGEALTTTAGGMIVAIIALFFFRISVTLQAQQMDYFAKVGSELELIYRHVWCEQGLTEEDTDRLESLPSILPASHPDAALVGSAHS
jgi:biopolymer transport protein ExbB